MGLRETQEFQKVVVVRVAKQAPLGARRAGGKRLARRAKSAYRH